MVAERYSEDGVDGEWGPAATPIRLQGVGRLSVQVRNKYTITSVTPLP